MAVTFAPGEALLIVDPQNDFCPGGSLGVPDGDLVMPVLNQWAAAAERDGAPIYISRDWHPRRTTHFAEFGGVWPPHCIVGTRGAEFHPEFEAPASAIVVSKGIGEHDDDYSAFHARLDDGTRLSELLRARGVDSLYVMGLATDYCVKESVLMGLQHGFKMSVVAEGIRAVNLKPTDGEQAIAAMRSAGAVLV